MKIYEEIGIEKATQENGGYVLRPYLETYAGEEHRLRQEF